jgi:hypothetical protein
MGWGSNCYDADGNYVDYIHKSDWSCFFWYSVPSTRTIAIRLAKEYLAKQLGDEANNDQLEDEDIQLMNFIENLKDERPSSFCDLEEEYLYLMDFVHCVDLPGQYYIGPSEEDGMAIYLGYDKWLYPEWYWEHKHDAVKVISLYNKQKARKIQAWWRIQLKKKIVNMFIHRWVLHPNSPYIRRIVNNIEQESIYV